MTNPKIKALIFDLGKVLVDVDFNDGLLALFTQNKTASAEAINRLYKEALFRDFNSGRLTPQNFYEALCKRFTLHLSYPEFVGKWCSVFKPLPGMAGLVKRLAENFDIGLLSDTDPLHWNYCLRHFPFLQIFKHPVLSFEVGHMKPSKLSFRTAAASVGHVLQECLFIDDRLENINGAIRAGMPALLFTSPYALKKNLQALNLL